jgi:hypothetical protein
MCLNGCDQRALRKGFWKHCDQALQECKSRCLISTPWNERFRSMTARQLGEAILSAKSDSSGMCFMKSAGVDQEVACRVAA